MKDNLIENSNKFENFSVKIKELFILIPLWDLNQTKAMKKFKDKHQELPIHETQFFTFIKEEPNKRELQNKYIFKTVNLNVELPKFKQYYFQVNIATF